MMHFESHNHSVQVYNALQNNDNECEVSIIGLGNNGGLHSDNLWLVSPFVRSIIGSLNNGEKNILIIPDFSIENIETALRIIERKKGSQDELFFFNSATKHFFETLGIDIKNYETAPEVKLEKEETNRTDEEIVQELLLAENTDFDSSDEEEESEQERVTVNEIIPKQNIKVENTDVDDLQVQMVGEQVLLDSVMISNESIISPLKSDLNEVFDKFMENFRTRDHNKVDETTSVKEEEDRDTGTETSPDEEPDTVSRTSDDNSTDDHSDIQEQKLREVEELLTRENRVWKCKECNKSFQTKENSRLHAELHVKGLKYFCNHCEQIFPARSKLRTHKHRYHRLSVEKHAGDSTDGNIEAPEDNEVENSFVERKEMKKGSDKNSSANTRNLHQQKLKEVEQLLIEDSGRWKCRKCNKTFTKRITLVYHAESHVSGLIYPCKRCTETFTTRLKLHRHKHEIHKDRKEDATIKDAAAERQDIHNEKLKEVDDLLIQVGKGGGWKCKVCGNLYPKKSQLRNHAETHVSGLSYPCLYCSEIRPNKNSLKSHIRVHHRDTFQHKSSTSTTDSNTGTTKRKIVKEMTDLEKRGKSPADKSESDVGPVSDSVELIPRSINREISEKIQELVEKRRESEWGCLKCFKTFTRKSNLQSHLETHLNYSHSCPQCSFTTAVRRALKVHHRDTHQNRK